MSDALAIAPEHVDPIGVLMTLATRMRDIPVHDLPVNKAEADFLRGITKEFPGKVRALWNPAPVRGQAPVEPTSVRLVCDDPSFTAFILWELMRFRRMPTLPKG